MPARVAIFDFDGTIADSLELAIQIGNQLSTEFNYRPVRSDEVSELRRRPYREVAREIGLAWHKIPSLAVRFRKEMARSAAQLQPIAGLPPVLRELQQSGVQLGICTSNARVNVERFLQAHAIDNFEFINTGSSVWGKARRLRSLLRQRDVPVDRAVYIGDEVRDIDASRELKLPVIAVSWGYTASEWLAANHPDYLISTPEQLLPILTKV